MIVKFTILFVALVMFGAASAQSEPTLQDVNAYIPPELQGKVDEAQIEKVGNKSKELFKEKCAKNGGPNAYPNVEKATQDLKVCLESLVNVSAIEQEVENAKPTGRVDEVFKKYCQKTPDFQKCFRTATEATKPCFSPPERENLKTIYNVTEQLAEFICFKEGDRIALFIAEGGKECFEDKQTEIQDCFNKTLNLNTTINPNEMMSVDNLPEIKFGEKECGQMSELQTCVVAVLEKCQQPTSANIVESLFKFIRKATPCNNLQTIKGPSGPSGRKAAEPSPTKGTASVLATSLVTVLMAITTAFAI